MRFTERPNFIYDPAMGGLADTVTALRIHDEYVRQYSARPAPRFLEVDRSTTKIDPLWHVPMSKQTQFIRQIILPAINKFERPNWNLTPIGIVPQRKDTFWVSNLGLQRVNWFPNRGDMVIWNGYRYGIIDVIVPPESYWGQTGVFLGLKMLAIIVPEGDIMPLDNVNVVTDPEMSPFLVPPPPPPIYNGPAYPEQLPPPTLEAPAPLPTNFAP